MLKRDDFYPHYIYAITNRYRFVYIRNHTRGYRCRRGSVSCFNPWMITSNINEDKSFADDLNLERGIVSSRVALLLRSTEIKPIVLWFVLFTRTFFFFSFLILIFRRVVKKIIMWMIVWLWKNLKLNFFLKKIFFNFSVGLSIESLVYIKLYLYIFIFIFIFFFILHTPPICSLLSLPTTLFDRLRPYTLENTGSRPISEVKLVMAQSVLWWGTTWEYCVS